MKQFLKDLFSENSGVSMVRIMSLLTILVGIVYLFLYGSSNPSGNFISLIAMLFAIGFTGKVAQKYFEVKDK